MVNVVCEPQPMFCWARLITWRPGWMLGGVRSGGGAEDVGGGWGVVGPAVGPFVGDFVGVGGPAVVGVGVGVALAEADGESDGEAESDGAGGALGDSPGAGSATPSPHVTCSSVSGTTIPSRVTSPSFARADPLSTAYRATPAFRTVEPPDPTDSFNGENARVVGCVSTSTRPLANRTSPVGWTGRPGWLTSTPSEASLSAHSNATPPPRNVRCAPDRS